MSPRRHFRRDDAVAFNAARARHGVQTTVVWRDGEWMVRAVPGDAAVKTYRCPGCQQEIRPGAAHVVAWPTTDWRGDASDRRHWHGGCWRARDRRGPR